MSAPQNTSPGNFRYSHGKHATGLGVLERRPHLGDEQLGLLETPSQDLADGEDDQPVERHVQRRVAVRAQLLQPLVLGPGAHGRPVDPLADVDESRRGAPFGHLLGHPERAARHLAGVIEELTPLLEDVVVVDDDVRVLGAELDVGLGVLEPAAGLEGLEDLAVELGPVADGAVEGAYVDEVEGGGLEGPVELGILDLEAEVRGHPAWLGRGDVDADDFRRGELVGNVAVWDVRLWALKPRVTRSVLTLPRYQCRCLHPGFSKAVSSDVPSRPSWGALGIPGHCLQWEHSRACRPSTWWSNGAYVCQ